MLPCFKPQHASSRPSCRTVRHSQPTSTPHWPRRGGGKENPRTHGRGAWWWNIGGNIWEPSSHPRGESCGDSCPWGPDFVDSNHPTASLNNVLARLKLKSWHELHFRELGAVLTKVVKWIYALIQTPKLLMANICRGNVAQCQEPTEEVPVFQSNTHYTEGDFDWFWIQSSILGHFFRHWKDFYLCSPAGYVPAAKRARPSPEGLGTEQYGRCLEMLPTNWGYLNRNI